jgi:hypothetical protein
VAARTTTSSATIDDVLYRFAKGITQSIGSSYSARHRAQNQDLRSLMWAKQYELLTHLDPRWATRAVRETAEKLRAWGYHDDVEL